MDKFFKKLVDDTKPSLVLNSVEELELECLYKHYEIDYENFLSTSHVQEHLYKNIRENLSGDQLDKNQLSNLKNQLLLAHFVKKQELQPYFGILEIIIEATRESTDQLVSFELKNNWQIALQSAWDITIIDRGRIKYDLQYLERLYKKQIKISEAAKFLQSEGHKINIKDGKIVIKESQERSIAKHIENDIKCLGGIETLKRLSEIIISDYCNEQDRYHLGRNLSFSPQDYPSLVPINYLLNLCVKNLFVISTQKRLMIFKKSNEIWQRILKRSTALAWILDVQLSTPFDLFFSRPETIVSFLQNLAIYNSLFCPIQLRSSDVPKIIEGLFSWLSEKTQKNLGWTPEQAAIIAKRILKIATENLNFPYPITFQSEQLYDLEPQIEKDIINKILTVYSHNLSTVNLNFQIIHDICKIDDKNYFQHKPLIQLSKSKYLLVNSSICSPAFYEAIFAEFRDKEHIIYEIPEKVKPENSQISPKLGPKIEDFIKTEFSIRGIKFKFGRYGTPKKGESQDEIDIVVEASDTLIFFEVKKKPLTRKARCGEDLELLIDLSESLLASQIQMNKHEIFIRKNESILLDDSSTFALNGRDIAKISVTLLDYGSFQDRSIIFNFLENMQLGEFEVNDNIGNRNINKKLRELNNQLDIFKCQLDELIKLNPRREENLFYNCWFLSVPQILILLDNVNSSDDLKREIWRNRSVSFSCMDFYKEYYHLRHPKLVLE